LLQVEADANGFDTDTAQAIMNEAFRPAAHAKPFIPQEPRKRDYWLVGEDGVASPAELERLQAGFAKREHEQHGAPQVTYDALVCAYQEAKRQGNTKVFEEPANKERLSRLSAKQRAHFAAFIQRCEQS
jgi:hypothetical protein